MAITTAARGAELGVVRQLGSSTLTCMEKIMSTYVGRIPSGPSHRMKDQQHRELQEDELDAVAGGLVVNAIIGVLIGLLLPAPPPTGGKPGIGPV
jgi:hypothetical protein